MMVAVDEVAELGRADGPHGEVALRERRRGAHVVHELVVNGVFAMDSTDTSSERGLAAFVPRGAGTARVLVGGLGLGYTAAAVLEGDPAGAVRVDVVEREPHLVAWARAGLTPVLRRVAQDPRTQLHVADVVAVRQGRTGPSGPWDAVLLDVDNGPDFLVHAENAGLYDRATLQAAHDRLAPGGLLALWCQGPAPELLATLATLGGAAREHRFPVQREGRSFCYVVCTLERAGAGSEARPGRGDG